MPLVSIVLVNTNELHHLRKCLPSLFAQSYAPFEVLIVDNVSTDGSLSWVREHYPQVRIIENESNLGYAGANNVGFEAAQGELVAVLNPDTEVAADWLEPLVDVLQSQPDVAIAAPKIVLMSDPSRINACGNQVTFTGLTFCRGLDRPSEEFCVNEPISAVSGAAFVIRREVLQRIGGFDESFFTYFEDTDLSLRATLAGYRLFCVPASVVKHLYVFKVSPRKVYFQERNRYYSLMKNLRWPTLLLLLPSFAISEVIVWGYFLMQQPSLLWQKLKSYGAIMHDLPKMLAARHKTQLLRKVPDRVILSRFDWRMTLTRTTHSSLLRLIEPIIAVPLFLSGQFARLLVWW